MRKIQLLGVALLAMFALSVATTASASAADEWLINGEALTLKHEVHAEGTLTYCDDKGGIFGEKICLSCSILEKGNVGAGKADQTVEVANLAGMTDIKNCTNVENCPGATLLEAENLPWKSEVVLSGAIFKDKIGPGTGGEPAFVIVCNGLTDLCEGGNALTLENVAKGVNQKYPPNVEPSTCTRGGMAQGLIEGTLFAFSLGELAVS